MALNRDDVVKLLRDARERGATELHFKVPNRPQLRIDGTLLPIGTAYLDPAATHQVAMALCNLAGLELPLASLTDKEFGFGLNGVGRFHVTLYRQRGSVAVLVQRSALDIPPLDKLGFGNDAEKAVLAAKGLVLVAGGRRRKALLASLVDRYNAVTRGYVVDIEDPLVYLHRDAMASIAQRGVGADVPSLAAGLRSAIRVHPDLIACCDVGDRESTDAVLDAVENGIPVLANVSAPRAADAASWLTRHYPALERPDQEARVRRHLKVVLTIPDDAPPECVLIGRNAS